MLFHICECFALKNGCFDPWEVDFEFLGRAMLFRPFAGVNGAGWLLFHRVWRRGLVLARGGVPVVMRAFEGLSGGVFRPLGSLYCTDAQY